MRLWVIAICFAALPAVAWADPCEGPLPRRAGETFSGQVRYIGDGDSLCVGNSSDPTTWIEVRAEESLIKERMKYSRVDSEADFEVYETIKKQWEPMQEHHLILQSTNDNLEEILNIAKDHLRLNDDQRTDRKNNPGS